MMKYELTDETKNVNGRMMYRIRALRDIDKFGIKKGDLGGWTESETNLSQEGDAWVSDDACVFGDEILCCRFRFCSRSQIEKWFELEKQFEKEAQELEVNE
jgi:hypothetical protein